MPITNAREYQEFAKRRDEILRRAMVEAMQMSIEQVAQMVRAEEFTEGTFGDQTANLRTSVGIDQRVAAAKAAIPGLADRAVRGLQVKELKREIVAVLGIGMEYARPVSERGPWPENALARADDIFTTNLKDRLALAARDIEALA